MLGPCGGLPIPRRTSEMVKKAQGKRKRAGIGALKAGAADHDVDPVMQDIRPDSRPQQFDSALVAIGFEHAGAAEFQKPQLRMGCEHRRDIVFARCVETLVSLSDVLTQQPIGADDLRLGASGTHIAGTVVENQQVIAETVEIVDVAPGKHRRPLCGRRHLLEENLIAQSLRPADIAGGEGEADFEGAKATEAWSKLPVIAHDAAWSAEKIPHPTGNGWFYPRNDGPGCYAGRDRRAGHRNLARTCAHPKVIRVVTCRRLICLAS